MRVELEFFVYEKYGQRVVGALNSEGILLMHRSEEGYDFKTTDVLHLTKFFDKYLLRPNGKLHTSERKYDTIFEEFVKLVHDSNPRNEGRKSDVPMPKIGEQVLYEDVIKMLLEDDREALKRVYEKGCEFLYGVPADECEAKV